VVQSYGDAQAGQGDEQRLQSLSSAGVPQTGQLAAPGQDDQQSHWPQAGQQQVEATPPQRLPG